jgi:hypothetical protein
LAQDYNRYPPKTRFTLYRKDWNSPFTPIPPRSIQVHSFYCLLALLLTSLLQRELARAGQPLSINSMLETLAGIRETVVV